MYHTYLKLFFSSILAILFIVYVGYQGRFFIIGPTLTVTEPSVVTQTSRSILVQGSVTHATLITVNGYPIDTDLAGNFSYPLVLPDGYSILTISARDRYGRERTETRSLFLAPEAATTTNQ
ncbi:hypothetical protein A3C87_01580 [Candidatus Kaiserbacteria bacterium RIFCSPHIGHO2_02_FULL_49_34]|uniref:Bacterial Ig domain-containing protein n=1 Tax=Candidatus Kaiserbacteria bacterium RIFCSPHIGHO2_02_FULL_49_34 TaxID=1798491 RepID=A0A1F6DIM5_9BACT|nr:MAG: hypothetical protein A3C87_01580 [Candidatus Kaiserbacteria bacterium RIFCSPHIGHO2_02_FULL_49_34]